MKNNGVLAITLSSIFILLACSTLAFSCKGLDKGQFNDQQPVCNKPLKPKPLPNDAYLVEIDSCEYIWTSHRFAHKGNCKYCKERREKELQELLKSINKENE